MQVFQKPPSASIIFFGKLHRVFIYKIIKMKLKRVSIPAIFFLTFLSLNLSLNSQSKGIKTITENELRYHLEFLGAEEFRGRETPSNELEIATVYIGNWVKYNGFKPLMPDGSFYQKIPLKVTAVSEAKTRMKVAKGKDEFLYYFSKSFGGNFQADGSYSGSVIFAGTGFNEIAELELTGKIVIIIDELYDKNAAESSPWLNSRLSDRAKIIREKGASALFSIVTPEKQKRITKASGFYDYIPTGRLGAIYDSQKTSFETNPGRKSQDERPSLPFTIAEINHALAANILGISEVEVAGLFETVRSGRNLAAKELKDVFVRLDVETETYMSTSRNVIALVEGSDPVLKNEYIIISGHHDGRGIDDGEIIPAADDNGTATVALMEIGQALLAERPKRSVILAWVTGEEQGMNGSHYFINNSPVPVEKISACLDMDMLGRNNPDSLFLVGSDLLSSELDASINNVNKKYGINFGFDYCYSNLTHPQRVYFRSDHYPFIRFGIPSVWFFCGFTNDYHTYRDAIEFIDYNKFLKVTRLVYLTAFDIGNMKNLLKLDINPAVTKRGGQNLREPSLFRGE